MSNSPVPQWSALSMSLFGVWLRFFMRSRFADVCVSVSGRPASEDTVLVVANHTSWWDGFLIYLLRWKLGCTTPMFTIMLENELLKHKWLRRLGCVGITPGDPASSRAVFDAVAEACRTEPGCWVLFFPQGRIVPSWHRPLDFRGGVTHLLKALGDVRVLPVALHIEPLISNRPTAFVVAGEARSGSGLSAIEIETLVGDELDCLQSYVGTSGENAARNWEHRSRGTIDATIA